MRLVGPESRTEGIHHGFQRVLLCRTEEGTDTESEPEPRRQSREDSRLFFPKKQGNVPHFLRKNKTFRYE